MSMNVEFLSWRFYLRFNKEQAQFLLDFILTLMYSRLHQHYFIQIFYWLRRNYQDQSHRNVYVAKHIR